ncbi:hypothetical protein QAD02_001071 [Eretmocerus hayati]|uniref:Uncharacterized protein n=1 Tax=Eretmocerus hayati TaxID=131215 RepID=A0ACC2NF78_9HYME|nr:hypothetical protein QAD02_001071 [Eretmocerus hayati]
MQPRLLVFGTIIETSIVLFLLTLQVTSIEVSPRFTECNSNEEPHACVDIKECRYFMYLLRMNPITGWRSVFTNICSTDQTNRRVCCPIEKNNNDGNKKPIESLMKPLSEIEEFHPYPSTASETKPSMGPIKFPQLNGFECGISDRRSDRIVGGAESTKGAWPWIASLGYVESEGIKFLCGGTLISSRHIVTAAHCVHSKKNLQLVRLGDHDLSSYYDNARAVELRIERQICHPNYKPSTGENDIAILRLQDEVRFSDYVRPICLPNNDNSLSGNLAGNLPYVAGWGSTYFNGPPSSTLLEAQVPIVDIRDCQKAYRMFRGNLIDDRIICAGYKQGGKDACQGDSGGPLMIPRHSRFYLIGIVSNGYKCAEPGYPGVYTKITSFLDFIASNMC